MLSSRTKPFPPSRVSERPPSMNKFNVVASVGTHPEPTGPSNAPACMDEVSDLRLIHGGRNDDPCDDPWLRTGRSRAR